MIFQQWVKELSTEDKPEYSFKSLEVLIGGENIVIREKAVKEVMENLLVQMAYRINLDIWIT